jgi:hypothetical protein
MMMRLAAISVVLGALLAAGCSKQGAGPDAPVSDSSAPDVPGIPGNPGLGAHSLVYYKLNQDPTARALATEAMSVQPSGSTIIVSVGRGELAAFSESAAIPTDNMGNSPYRQVDVTRKYMNWPSGTALYQFPSARGGANHVITTFTPENDEITMAAVEVVSSSRIQDYKWNEVLQAPLTSLEVTTTGPATLVAFWWGDGFPRIPQDAKPNNGFVRIDTNAEETDSFVQCAVAVKNVAEPGKYNVTWTATPAQGAQMWLVAVQ